MNRLGEWFNWPIHKDVTCLIPEQFISPISTQGHDSDSQKAH